MSQYNPDDSHFRQFASCLESAIAREKVPDNVNFLKLQKQQVEALVKTEKEFRRTICSYTSGRTGRHIYNAFIRYICEDRRNILAARPFFRERQTIFTKSISQALKDKDFKALQKFNFNFHFIQFVLDHYKWPENHRLVKLGKKIIELRATLVTMNMPLAISRARIFYSRTPKAQLEYMDLVQISCEGLMSAIDKFVLPYTSAFRSVAIGRMTGNFIEQYSETLVHFYPVDKRKIYRANKLLRRNTDTIDFVALAGKVNHGVEKPGLTNPSELAGLLAAQSYVSTEQTVRDGEDEVSVADRYAAPASCQPDIQFEAMDTHRSLKQAFNSLSPMDRKILRLKGVDL